MDEDKQQRALVVVGAGASVEYGIPATASLGANELSRSRATRYQNPNQTRKLSLALRSKLRGMRPKEIKNEISAAIMK